jgi:hypothetical protein
VIRLYGFFFLVDLALVLVALIDCLCTDEYAVRNLPKVPWVFIILLFSPVGAIAWFVAGRPQNHRVGRAGEWRPGGGFPEHQRPRPLAPDDEPGTSCETGPAASARTTRCSPSGRPTCAAVRRSFGAGTRRIPPTDRYFCVMPARRT